MQQRWRAAAGSLMIGTSFGLLCAGVLQALSL